MSYATVSVLSQDPYIRDRVTACIAVESISENPEEWVYTRSWALASQPGWAAAWESARAANVEEEYEPGRDEAVITDGMILSAVQAIAAAEAPEAPEAE